jgi:hypothetical protein
MKRRGFLASLLALLAAPFAALAGKNGVTKPLLSSNQADALTGTIPFEYIGGLTVNGDKWSAFTSAEPMIFPQYVIPGAIAVSSYQISDRGPDGERRIVQRATFDPPIPYEAFHALVNRGRLRQTPIVYGEISDEELPERFARVEGAPAPEYVDLFGQRYVGTDFIQSNRPPLTLYRRPPRTRTRGG